MVFFWNLCVQNIFVADFWDEMDVLCFNTYWWHWSCRVRCLKSMCHFGVVASSWPVWRLPSGVSGVRFQATTDHEWQVEFNWCVHILAADHLPRKFNMKPPKKTPNWNGKSSEPKTSILFGSDVKCAGCKSLTQYKSWFRMSGSMHFRRGESEAFRVRGEDMLGQTASGYLCGAQPYLNKFQAIIAKKQSMSSHLPTHGLSHRFSCNKRLKTDWFKCGSHLYNRVSPQKEQV